MSISSDLWVFVYLFIKTFIKLSELLVFAQTLTAVIAGNGENPSIAEQPYFKVYPNPTEGKFTVEYAGKDNPSLISVEIFNMNGPRILSKDMTDECRHEFTLENRPKGIYLVKMVTNGVATTARIIKK